MIEITGVDLAKFAQKVYELSSPQGLGFLHFTSEPLSDEEAKEILDVWKNDKQFALGMDYIKGRACKMHVWRKDGKLQISDSWYDHTDEQLDSLLSEFGISKTEKRKHGIACNCVDCQSKRG